MEAKPTQSITRSYSKKVQIAQWSPVESFASQSFQWYDTYPSEQEVVAKSEELFTLCKEMVEADIAKMTGDAERKKYFSEKPKKTNTESSIELDLD